MAELHEIGGGGLKGVLFLISGPSGVGKGTVIRHLKERYPAFIYPISHTTREIRPGEVDGGVYHFITREEFESGVENGEFLEYAYVHGLNYYGTLKEPIVSALERGEVVVREVDVQGVESIMKVFGSRNLVTIFLKAEDEERLLARIAKRGELPEDELNRRMESARKEMAKAGIFDYQVFSLENKIPECVDEVAGIVESECQKRRIEV